MGGGGRPGKNPPGEQIDHERDIGEPCPSRHVREVCDPDLVRCIGAEVTVQQVLGPVPILGPDRGGGPPTAHQAVHPGYPHQPIHGVLGNIRVPVVT